MIQTDILKFSFPKHINYKIYGNIPYNISTDIVKRITFESQAKYSYLIVEKGFEKIAKSATSFGFTINGGDGYKNAQKVPPLYFHPKPKTLY